MKKIYRIILMLGVVALLLSCEGKNIFTDSIFDDEPALDPDSYTYEFDKWLYDNYLIPYNLDFKYKMQDVGSDTDYNLVPARLKQAEQLAHLARYLWFDVYDDIVSEDFLKLYGPRMMHLIGSPAINASLHTEVLGTAEGGIKVTLYKVNDLDPADIDFMNEYYFKTMHHEFAHILHQTKNYPKEYEAISAGQYDPDGWQTIKNDSANKLGFVSNYSRSQPREDFVEVIANYIVKNDAQWNKILENAQKGIIKKATKETPAITGRDIIEQKWGICRKWLLEKWDIDLDVLRNEVQYRQDNLDMEKIMNDDY